jgi:iron complex outermembrane receptor protein
MIAPAGVSAKWTPAPNFTAIVSYDKAKDENTPNYSQLINYNPLGKPVGHISRTPTATASTSCCAGHDHGLLFVHRAAVLLMSPTGDKRVSVAPIGVPQQPSVDRTEGTSLHLSYDLRRTATALDHRVAHRLDRPVGQFRRRGAHDLAPNTGFSRYSLSFLNQRQFSQELQLVGSLPQVDYVLGAYYFNERAQEQAATPSSNTWNVDGTGYTINSETVVGPVTSATRAGRSASSSSSAPARPMPRAMPRSARRRSLPTR